MADEETIVIQQLQDELDETPRTSSEWSYLTTILGKSFYNRFRKLGRQDDLESAIQRYREVYDEVTLNRAQPAQRFLFRCLRDAFASRYKHTNALADLDAFIEFGQRTISLMLRRDDDWGRSHAALGKGLLRRYLRTWNDVDVRAALQCTRRAYYATPENHESRPRLLDSYCVSYFSWACLLGDASDLDSCIAVHEDNINNLKSFNGDITSTLYNIGELLHRKYKITHDIDDIQQAVQRLSEVVDAIPSSHSNKVMCLVGLGSHFICKHEATGDVGHVTNAISYIQMALDLTPDTSPERCRQLQLIASAYATRHQATGQTEDLESCIERLQEALNLVPPEQRSRAHLLRVLCVGHILIYQAKGSRSQLEASSQRLREATTLESTLQGSLHVARDPWYDPSSKQLFFDDRSNPNLLALHAAAIHGHDDIVEEYIAKVVGTEFEEHWMRAPPLHQATTKGYVEVVRLLLQNGADVHKETADQGTALYVAAKNGHVDIARLLIERGANINAQTSQEPDSPLSVAAWAGRREMVKLLLGLGADVNSCSEEHGTALILACLSGDEAIAQILYEHGANLSLCCPTGNALQGAAYHGHHGIARLLLSWGFDVNQADKNVPPPMFLAAARGHTEVVRVVMDSGVDIEQTEGGRTALQWAADNGHKDVAQFLLSAGAEARQTDPRGLTTLHRAVYSGDVDRVTAVMAQGASRLAADVAGRTPLMLACMRGREAVVMAFLSTDTTDIDMRDSYDSTPLSIAARHGHSGIVRQLLLRKPRLMLAHPDRFGRSPLRWATLRGHVEVAQLIVVHGLERDISVEQDGEKYAEEKNQEGEGSEVMSKPTTTIEGASASGSASRECHVCTLSISQEDAYHHCLACNGGDFDICQECFDLGARCLDSAHVITTQPKKRIEDDIETEEVDSKS